MKIFLLFFLFFFAVTACTVTPNGCGSGWTSSVVPDRVKVAKCEFKPACDQHDICYGQCEGSEQGVCEYKKCQIGGTFFGQQQCFEGDMLKKILDSKTRRTNCDKALFNEIKANNNEKPICTAFAAVYWLGVRGFGGGFWDGATAEESNTLPETQKHNELTMKTFWETASDAELKTFEEQVVSKQLKVNFNKRVYYKKGTGLIN